MPALGQGGMNRGKEMTLWGCPGRWVSLGTSALCSLMRFCLGRIKAPPVPHKEGDGSGTGGSS